MNEFFALDYHGEPFELFGTAHLIALAGVVLVNVLIFLFRRRFSAAGRRRLRYVLAGVLLVVELSWHGWNAATGQWTLQTMLPLHLCSALVWLSIYMLITGNQRIYEFAYLLGIPGALQALLTPDAGIYGYPHFRFFQVILSHGTLVTAALALTWVEGYRPTLASLKRVFITGNIYLAAVFVFNLLIGSNYLFIAHKPETASLLDVLPPWPWYIAVIELLGLVFVLVMYAPFFVRDLRARRKAVQADGLSSK